MGIGWRAFHRNIRARFEGLEHLRLISLGALACLSLAELIVAGRHTPIFLWGYVAVACGSAFLAAVFVLRHAGLAALVASAPLPGVLAFLAAIPVRDAPVGAGYCLGLGLTVSVLMGDVIAVSAICGDAGEPIPGWAGRSNGRFIAAVLAVFLVPALACAAVFPGYRYLEVAAAGALAVVSAAVVVRLGSPCWDYGEDYVARANRSRERFARFFSPILPVARPRFGFSVFGIACVMAALAFFGAQPLRVAPAIGLWPISVVAVLIAGSSLAVLRDWRRSLAVLLSAALAVQIGIWSFARAGVAITSATQAVLLIAVSVVFALQLSAAQEASGVIATEDDAVAGSERAIETKATPVCVASAVGILAMLPFSVGELPIWCCCGATIAAAALSAVLFQPAIAITIESLVPRAATIAARYRL